MSRESAWIEDLRQAMEIQHLPEDRLYWNGEMFCWCRPRFIRRDSGWVLVFIPPYLLEQFDEESVCAA